jgi:DNA-binding transcriptional regulator YhcF (GntR family)
MSERATGVAMRTQILQAILHLAVAHGMPPTNREIGEEVGGKSTGHIDYHLRYLEEQGFITIDRHRTRGIRITEQGPAVARNAPEGASADDARREQAPRTPTSALPSTGALKDALPVPREHQLGVAAASTGPRLSRADRHAWALEHLRTAGTLSPRAYAGALAVSVDTALRDLQALVDQGIVRAAGTTRDRRYLLAREAAKPAIRRIPP